MSAPAGPPQVAIDFGTSFSSAAVVVGDRMIAVKEPSSGSYSLPSAVCVDGDGRLLVGTPAEHAKRRRPDCYRNEFKRDLGRSTQISLGERAFAVEELVAALLGALRTQAGLVAGAEPTGGVITVPAAAGSVQRGAMLAAAARAGLDPDAVQLVAEPVAAAHAPAAGGPLQPGELVLVYDFGGGTFDAALVRIGDDGTAHQVVDHTGLPHVGGYDVDQLVYADIVASGGEESRARLTVPPQADQRAVLAARRAQLELLDMTRRIKHQLSEADTAGDYFVAGDIEYELTRRRFDALIAPLVEETIECCTGLLERNQVPADQLAAVLLVGGSTRMPLVAETLRARLGRPLRRPEDPELAVAHGAAAGLIGGARRRAAARATTTTRGKAAGTRTKAEPAAQPTILAQGLTGQLIVDATHVRLLRRGHPLVPTPLEGRDLAIPLRSVSEVWFRPPQLRLDPPPGNAGEDWVAELEDRNPDLIEEVEQKAGVLRISTAGQSSGRSSSFLLDTTAVLFDRNQERDFTRARALIAERQGTQDRTTPDRGTGLGPSSPSRGTDLKANALVHATTAAGGGVVTLRVKASGLVERSEQVRIPAGLTDGTVLRIPGRGRPGSPPGDLLVRVQVMRTPASTTAERPTGQGAPPASDPPATAPVATGTLRLFRLRRYSGSAMRFHVLVDGTDRGMIANGKNLAVDLPAGQHTLVVKGGGQKTKPLVVLIQPGKALAAQCWPGVWTTMNLTVVDG